MASKNARESKHKSVFDMSAEEFKSHVRPRAVELANDHWNKGLSVTAPTEHPDQFLHIYKNKKVKLAEVNPETGEVKYIEDIS